MNIHEALNSGFWSWLLNEAWSRVSGINGLMLLIFWGVFALAVVFTYLHSAAPRSFHGLLAHVLPPKTLQHPSARADLLFWLSRRIFMPLLVLPTALSTVTAGRCAYLLLGHVVGFSPHAPGPLAPWQLVAFTVTMFLAFDLSYYIYHYLQHRVPLLWELHKVHHSAEVMVGVTKDRVHPLDEIMNRWWDGIIPGLTYGIWLFFAFDPVELTIFGINVYFLRNTVLMMDFVRHTHLKVSYGRWFNSILLCPHYHQLHHSVASHHWDKNFGLTLSIWDRMFGTLRVPEPGEDFTFGLPDGGASEYQSLFRLHILPLSKIARLVRHRLRPRPDGLLVPTTD